MEDENGYAPEKVEIKTKTRALIGTWHDIHDRSITFARRFHQVEPHKGHMWALAAYTPRAALPVDERRWTLQGLHSRLSASFKMKERGNRPHRSLHLKTFEMHFNADEGFYRLSAFFKMKKRGKRPHRSLHVKTFEMHFNAAEGYCA